MKIKPLFAWYDLWIGIFIDAYRTKIYILPLPMLGIVIDYFKLKRWYESEIEFHFGTLKCFFKGHEWEFDKYSSIPAPQCKNCYGWYDLMEPPFPSFYDIKERFFGK